MFKVSTLRAKIKRSGVNFKNTVLWDDFEIKYSNNNTIVRLFLGDKEEIIMHYVESKDYKWILTNERLIFPNHDRQFKLADFVDVDFVNVKTNPHKKMTNTQLTLSTSNESFKLFVEEKTWHLFYEIFKFVIQSNKK